MGDYDDDVERVDSDYVDPNSVTRDDIRADLEDAGIEGNEADMFEDQIYNEGDAVDETRSRHGDGIITREDVETTVSGTSRPHAEDRDDALTDAAAQEIGAPTEDSLAQARASVAQRVDEDGVVRTDPSLDPLGGEDGREIGTVSEVTRNTGGRGGGLRETVEPTGRGTGTYYYENTETGERFPVAEVDL